MSDRPCPICRGPLATAGSERYRCDSRLCRGIFFVRHLVIAPNTADNWPQLLSAARELNSIYHGGATIVYDGTDCYAQCAALDGSGRQHEIHTYPASVRERAVKLLEALARMTSDFGQRVTLDANDYPLAYVDSPEKLSPYLHYLKENGYLAVELEAMSHDTVVSLTAAGLEACESGSIAPQRIVFISSTCRDLIDCREELARHLLEKGYLVRLSDQPSTFELAPDAGALASCLHNVEKSDIVIAILDSRYGCPVPSGDYAGKSVTHAEIDRAMSCGIPVRAFIRRPAFTDWESIKNDRSSKSNWIEPDDEARRKGWMDLASRLSQHGGDGLESRWIDQFNSVVDLKGLVCERLRAIRCGGR